MIGGYRQIDIIIAEIESKLTLSEELLILPSYHIVIYTHPGEPLADDVQVIFVFREILHPAATIVVGGILDTVIDAIGPFYGERKFLTRRQTFREIHAHHRLIDHKR